MDPRVHTNRNVNVEDVQLALSRLLGADYQVTVASPSTVKVQGRVMAATVHTAHSAEGTDLRVNGSGLVFLRILNALTIAPRVRHALDSSFPDQTELRRAYRWG
jgi:hypothetical protein